MATAFKFLIALIFVTANAFAEDLQSPLVDSAGMIDSRKAPEVISALESLRRERDLWLVVWTLPELGGESIESLAVKQFKTWRIGAEKKDNGLLLVVAAKERKMKLEVGYGLEGDIPDITAKHLLDTHLRPHLKNNDLAGGIFALIAALKGQSENPTPTAPPKAAPPITYSDDVKKHVIDFTGALDQQTLNYMYDQIQWKAKDGIDLWLYFSSDDKSDSAVDHKTTPIKDHQVVLFFNMRDLNARLLNSPDFADQKFWVEFISDLSQTMKRAHIINALGSTNGTMERYLRNQEFANERKRLNTESAAQNRVWAMALGLLLAAVSYLLGFRFENKIIRLKQQDINAVDQSSFERICSRFISFYKKTIPLLTVFLVSLIYFFLNDSTGTIPTLEVLLMGPLFLGSMFISGWAYQKLYTPEMSENKKRILIEILGRPPSGGSSGGGGSSGRSYSSSSSSRSSSSSSYSGGGRSGGGGASSDW